MMRSFSFSAYLTGMALIIALPLTGLLAYDIRNDFRKSQEQAEAIGLQFAKLAAEQAENRLRQGKRILTGLAQIPGVRALDPGKCSTLLRELNELLEQYSNVITRDAAGALVCSAVPPAGGERPRAASDYHLQEVLRTGDFVVGKPVRGNITGKWVAALAYPLRDGQNSIAGVVALPMDLVVFHPAAGAASLPDGMVVQIISAEGVAIASTQETGAWVGRNVRDAEFVARTVMAQPATLLAQDAEGIPRIYGFAAVSGTDWRVYAGIPAAAVFDNAWRELRYHLAIVVLTLTMAALLAFLLARRASGSVRNIAAAAAAVGAGDKTARALPAGPAEIRAVATRFNAMLDALDLAEQRMSGIIRSAMDGVITVNERHEIILVNPAAEKLFGYSAADLLGKPLNILIPDHYQPGQGEHIRNFGRTNVAQRMMGRFGEIIGRRADGTEFAIDASISQMEQAGQRQFTVIMRDVTRRIEAENALRESERRLRLAVTSGGVGLWEWDIAANKLVWNEQTKTIFGLPQISDGLTVEIFLSAIHPDDRDVARQLYTAALENHTEFDHTFRVVHPGGDVRWVVSKGHGLYDPDGRPSGMIGATLDITERKRAELALQENYEILDKIFATTHFCIVYLDRHFNFIRVNKAYADVCGYPPGFFKGKNHFELYPGEEAEAIFHRVVATGEPFTTHARPFQFLDHPEWGTTYWDWTLHPVRSAGGEIEGLLFALLDVTAHTRAAETERENALRLRLAARAGNIGFWDRDITSDRVYFSSEWKSQLGYRDEEMPDDNEAWMSRLHPEDRDRVISHFNACVESRRSDYQTEYRMLHKDGSYRWFYVRGELLSAAAGAPQRVVGCRIDITAFKRVQQELESRIALAQLLESLARAASEAKGPAEAMRVCLERLCEFGQWTLGRVASCRPRGSLHIPDSETWHSTTDAAGFDEFISGSYNLDHIKPGGRFLSRVLLERKPAWIPDITTALDYGRRSIALAHGLRAAFAFPLVMQDEVTGFFEFYAATPRPPDPLLMEASELIASQLAVVIERSRAREIQVKLAAIVESSNDAIVSRDRDGTVLSWNAAAERMFGWTAREAIGQRLRRLIVPPDRIGALQPWVKRALRGEHVSPVEIAFMRKDGKRIDAYVTLSGIKDGRDDVSALALTISDITELKRKEKALEEYSMRLRKLSVRLLEVEEAERRSISRELHDRIGQDLSALNLIFGMLRAQFPEESRTAAQSQLKDIQGLLGAIVANVRDVMSELRPPVLDDYGLLAALRQLLASFSERTTISADIKGNDLSARLPSVVETAMFRICQEALSNIAKHAQAQKVEVSLNEDSGRIVLEIADDGVGFDLEDMPQNKATWGITTMRERAEAVGIGFRLESTPGSGTRVELDITRGAA
ncbi:MAG: PAS domain S-box protein [Burkholderiales bacterium]|nr:PAS domain S-box protein [Burkholderiales bacterium]